MICGFCKEPITNMSGRQSSSHAVHHKNGNHDDTRPENEMDCHYGCHQRHHILTIPKEELMKRGRNVGLKNKGKKWTIERRKKRSKDYMGRPGYCLGYKRSEETLERMRVSQRERREREIELRGILVASQ